MDHIKKLKKYLVDLNDENLNLSFDHYLKQVAAFDKIPEGFTSGYTLRFELPYVAEGCRTEFSHKIFNHLQTKDVRLYPDIQLSWVVQAHSQNTSQNLTEVKHIIAVASGKGGVGKSTTAINLALALSMEGARVGLLDADIYGPNQPAMLGVAQAKPSPSTTSEKKLAPVLSYGIQSMSIAYLIDENQAMIWRGPMASSAVQQLLHDTAWYDLDFLIVDLPPGTGDVQLTLAQKIPVTGAVIVTTPQDIALLDVKKAMAMFDKVRIPVLGIVENMSHYQCAQCGHIDPIFGTEGGAELAAQRHIQLLAQLPLHTDIRTQADLGCPIVIAQPQSPIAQLYRAAARKLSIAVAHLQLHSRSRFPKIVIE